MLRKPTDTIRRCNMGTAILSNNPKNQYCRGFSYEIICIVLAQGTVKLLQVKFADPVHFKMAAFKISFSKN